MPETVDPKTTAFASFLNDPRFPSDGTIPDQLKQFQPRGGFAWDIGQTGKTVLRGSAGLYYARQNMLSQVGSVTTNGIQQKSDFRASGFGDMPVWPNLLPPSATAPGTFPLFTGIRVFDRDYTNPRIVSVNVGFERELMPSMAAYVDFTVAKGTHLTRFLNYNVHGTAAAAIQPATRDTTTYVGRNPFELQLGDVFVTTSKGRALYRGATFGVRKRYAQKYQFELNYVLAKDEDDDSNERDPFTDRSFNFYDLSLDYGPSDRDIRHKVNFFTYAELPGPCAGERENAGADGAADHDVAARVERRRPRAQLGSEGQRVFLVRLAAAAAVRLRPRAGDPEPRDVQHVQQRQQRQPADDGGALQLRRLPAPGCRRPAPGAAGRQGHVLKRQKEKRKTKKQNTDSPPPVLFFYFLVWGWGGFFPPPYRAAGCPAVLTKMTTNAPKVWGLLFFFWNEKPLKKRGFFLFLCPAKNPKNKRQSRGSERENALKQTNRSCSRAPHPPRH